MRQPHTPPGIELLPSKRRGVESTTTEFQLTNNIQNNSEESTNKLLPTFLDVPMENNLPPDLEQNTARITVTKVISISTISSILTNISTTTTNNTTVSTSTSTPKTALANSSTAIPKNQQQAATDHFVFPSNTKQKPIKRFGKHLVNNHPVQDLFPETTYSSLQLFQQTLVTLISLMEHKILKQYFN